METRGVNSRALAFYHSKGFAAAWKLATKFAGAGGRIATVPDVIDARLHTKPGTVPWERYVTTLSAEYVGYTRGGKRILIVAHGVGPMATLAGIRKAYSFHYNGGNRDRRGGRITYDQFHALESGKYGEVSIVDLDGYLKLYDYPFIEAPSGYLSRKDPLVHARLGKKAREYVELHYSFAREWHKEQAGIDEDNRYKLPNWEQYLERRRKAHLKYAEWMFMGAPILIMKGDANCPYGISPEKARECGQNPDEMKFPLERDGLPIAHLLTIGRLTNCFFHEEDCGNLVCDVYCHEWGGGVRMVGIQGKNPIYDILEGSFALRSRFAKLWPKLLVPDTSKMTPVLFQLTKRGGQWFTQNQDTGDLEFVVTSIKKVGRTKIFRTSIRGYHGIFRHTVEEVVAYTPEGANAYHFVDFPEKAKIEWRDGNPEFHVTPIDFYDIEVDLSRRMMTSEEQENNLNLLEELANS